MTDDPADLAHLADIVVPPPVPWWPPAPGWWVLGAGLFVTLAILFAAVLRRYRHNAYRRAALAELAGIGTITDAAGAASVSAILKRTALVAYPRQQVAALTGDRWLAFLDRSAGTRDFVDGPAAGLTRAAYGAPPGDGDAVLAAARRWVRQHRAGT